MFLNPRVTVTDEEENPLGRFATRALRDLSRAKIGITEASGLYTELLLVEGAEPDAFGGFFATATGSIPAGTPAIVMSIGLVERLGYDTDAAAYLLGHETAHLLKGHAAREETRVLPLRRIRVLTEAGANDSSRPATDAILFAVVRPLGPYTKEQEKEAHEAGTRYAKAAGYDPAGAQRLARLLGQGLATGSSPWSREHLRALEH